MIEEPRGLRDRVDDLWWRLFLSRYTSWRQDRAYRKWIAEYSASCEDRQG